MGQYYKAIVLGPKSLTKKELIRLWMSPYAYGNGSKLMEHSYIGNSYVESFEFLLSPEGRAYMSRVVWAGDYADEEPVPTGTQEPKQDEEKEAQNLYSLAADDESDETIGNLLLQPPKRSTTKYRYIVNHDKKQYVDKQKVKPDAEHHELRIHPLPLLTAEGNGRGGGDFRGRDEDKVGIWARDVISVEEQPPPDYTELEVDFME